MLDNSYVMMVVTTANTASSALTLNINSTGAKTIYINGAVSSSSNHTLPAGSYIVYYDGTNYHLRTDGKIPGYDNISFTSSDVADGSATSWTSVAAITSGSDRSSLFGKISQMFKNIRYLYNAKCNKPIWVDMGSISSLPVTKNAAGVTTDMICAEAVLGTPSVQTGDWTISTASAGSITVSGTISGTTTLKLLMVPQNSVTATNPT